jgi:hypothetical protein
LWVKFSPWGGEVHFPLKAGFQILRLEGKRIAGQEFRVPGQFMPGNFHEHILKTASVIPGGGGTDPRFFPDLVVKVFDKFRPGFF